MKALFTGFFNVSLSGSVIILLVILLRFVLKRAPKAMICFLWTLVVIRLLLPFQIRSPWSLEPELPRISEETTQLFIESKALPGDQVPDFVPQVSADDHETGMVRIDHVAVTGVVWAAIVCAVGAYTLIAYLRLKYRVREAVLYKDRVFISPNIDTAFLLGYIRPRIYLPASMDEQAADLVIAHEQAHLKRGDNWLKLLGFICLALHWYNPLAWVAYLLLCKDIEGPVTS